jgi:hypothetical protein
MCSFSDTPFQSSSLAENTFLKTIEKDPLELLQQTTWRLLRTYPDGFRQALNYQYHDDMMALCYGKFLDNGGCGYVLKADYLIRAEQNRFNPLNPEYHSIDKPILLTIKIISGQFFSRKHKKSSDIPDPYVRVSIHGLSCDEQKQKTAVIDNNGLNPIWNETFTFTIRYPQMSLIYFSVVDHDPLTSNNRIAFFCLPVRLMRTGTPHALPITGNSCIIE